MRINFLIITVFLIMGFMSLIPVSSGETQENQVVISENLKKAILAEDWNTVADLCGPDEQLASPPVMQAVLRAIKGHACLALNRNNESLCLFLLINNEKDSEFWDEWTRKFMDANSTNHVAHYFRGDALARLGEWDSAIKAFDEALRLNPNFALALNGRGVVYHALGNDLAAREDFSKAIKSNSKFADAYASRGTLNIRTKAVRGAEKAYEEALNISPNFDLARMGRGCAFYGFQLFDKAKEDLKGVLSNPELNLLSKYNIHAVEIALLDKTIERDRDVGMNVSIYEFKRDEIMKAMESLGISLKDKGGRLPRPNPPDRGPKPGQSGKPGGKPTPTPPYPWPEKPPIWVPQPGPPPLPDNPDPPVMPIPDYRASEGGGADTKDIENIRSNKGNWLVFNWYGLVY